MPPLPALRFFNRGTLEHRPACPFWQQYPPWVSHPPAEHILLDGLDATRREFLATRGLAVHQVLIGPARDDESVVWITEPPDPSRQDLRWYGDGSVYFLRLAAATAAASMVVLDSDLNFVAAGYILVPSRVTTAPMAEAHFVAFALEYMVEPPVVVTDCQSLLTAASTRPLAVLCGAKSVLARLWSRISWACDGKLMEWANSGRFLWIPAHQSASGIHNLRKSDGSPVLYPEWRANRLADALAKFGARSLIVDADLASGGKALKLTMNAFTSAAAALGVVTHLSNNAPNPAGSGPNSTLRDSEEHAQRKK